MADHDTSTCCCCDGIAARAPVAPETSPLLAEIVYRSGDWQTFRDTMLARLGSSDAGSLAALSTRDPRDPTIALIDAWAVAGDILAFYNERLMSEGLLRTAEERDSLHQLARLIGYQPGPGVAASADIAFTMDTIDGAPRSIVLAPGVRIQSTPGPDEQPVTYETIEAIKARPAWNALRPRLDKAHDLDSATTELWVDGTTLAAAAGDGVLSFAGAAPIFATVHQVIRRPGDRAADPDARDYTVLKVRALTSAAIHNDGFSILTASPFPDEPAASYAGRLIAAGDLAAELAAAGHDEAKVFDIFASTKAPARTVMLFRARAPMFGHNAPPFGALPAALTSLQPKYKINSAGNVVQDGSTSGAFTGLGNAWAEEDLDTLDSNGDGTLHLEGAQTALAAGQTVVLRDGDTWAVYRAEDAAETSYARFALQGKATRMALSATTGFSSLSIRGTIAHFGGETVALGRPPLTTSVSDGSTEPLVLNGYAPGLQKGQRIAISGQRQGDALAGTTVMATLDEVVHDFSPGGGTTVRFSPALSWPMARRSVRINANVAAATHGESVAELLGSGDAAVPFLSASLKQAPQTHVTDDSPSGSAPTLAIRVNDIRWARVPSLLGAGPQDRVYTTAIDATGTTRVRFGDGVTGARPPTGSQNIRATYRKGLGLAGRVPAGSLNVLMSRPLGLSGAVNPLPSSGGADPEPVDAIRGNAPLTVRTLDRAVSAIDFEDFARAYAGIAKAEARLLADGLREIVHLTVAGEEGEQVLPGTALHDGLSGAIAGASDPYRRVLISSYRPATFRIAARIKTDPDHIAEKVIDAVRARLRAAFGFAARRFSQTVWRSEILAQMHAVAGVVAVDITALHRDLDPEGTPLPVDDLEGLGAESMRLGPDGQALGAELLTLNPGRLDSLVELT